MIDHLLQIRVLQIRVLQIRVLQIRVLQIRVLQIRVLQIRVLQIRVLQIRVLQIRVLQIHVLQIQSVFYKSNPVGVLQYAPIKYEKSFVPRISRRRTFRKSTTGFGKSVCYMVHFSFNMFTIFFDPSPMLIVNQSFLS